MGVAALVWAGMAVAQSGTRQTTRFVFSQQLPGASSGLAIDIDYVNPDSADAKAPAVVTVHEILAPGSRIDTTAPEQCTASDGALAAQGAAACPAGSIVGGGTVDLDTGMPGPGRIVKNKITQINNKDELILLFEQESGTRTPSRAKVTANTITAEVPPIPGGPPDGFTAIKTVRLVLNAVTSGQGGARKSYVTTPDTCPPAGFWTNTVEFTYRDGQKQVTKSNSPCQAAPPELDRTEPRVLVGVPSRCATKSFKARVRVRDGSRLKSVQVRVNGRLVRTLVSKRFRIRVFADGMSAGRHTVAVTATDAAGNSATKTAAFSRC